MGTPAHAKCQVPHATCTPRARALDPMLTPPLQAGDTGLRAGEHLSIFTFTLCIRYIVSFPDS